MDRTLAEMGVQVGQTDSINSHGRYRTSSQPGIFYARAWYSVFLRRAGHDAGDSDSSPPETSGPHPAAVSTAHITQLEESCASY